MQQKFLECEDLDIVAIHMYGADDFDSKKVGDYVTKAQATKKLLMVQEWYIVSLSSTLSAHH